MPMAAIGARPTSFAVSIDDWRLVRRVFRPHRDVRWLDGAYRESWELMRRGVERAGHVVVAVVASSYSYHSWEKMRLLHSHCGE